MSGKTKKHHLETEAQRAKHFKSHERNEAEKLRQGHTQRNRDDKFSADYDLNQDAPKFSSDLYRGFMAVKTVNGLPGDVSEVERSVVPTVSS